MPAGISLTGNQRSVVWPCFHAIDLPRQVTGPPIEWRMIPNPRPNVVIKTFLIRAETEMILTRLLAGTLVALSLMSGAGCTRVQVTDYAANNPVFVPEAFFDGDLTAHGVIKNRAGKVIRYFNVDIVAYWRDGIGTLEEDFVFDDGSKDRRVWTLTPTGTASYRGTAHDVIGEGVISVAGNSMFLDYVLRIPYGDSTIDLRIDDRMYLVSPDVLINESKMQKFGFGVGQILLVIQRRAQP